MGTSNAVNTAKKSKKAVIKANKAVERATILAQRAAAKAAKSGAKTNKAVEATAKSLEIAKAKLMQAQTAADTATTSVTETAAKADRARTLAHNIVQSWRAGFDNVTASTTAATALAKLTSLETCQLHQPPCSKCKGSQCQCGGTPQLFLTLSTKSLEHLRGRFGTAKHVGRSMPP